METQSKGSLLMLMLATAMLVTAIAGCDKTADAKEETPASAKKETATTADAAKVDKVVVYYFHNTRRCPTCKGIQESIEETIDAKFSKDVDAGMLEFRELNMEEEPNKKYVQQFQLSFSTMIVAAQAKGETKRWENAGKVWDFAHSPDELKSYVEKMIKRQLDLIGRSI